MNRVETHANHRYTNEKAHIVPLRQMPPIGVASCLATVAETANYAIRNAAQVDRYWRAHALFTAAKQVRCAG